jgi:hypothetical protein
MRSWIGFKKSVLLGFAILLIIPSNSYAISPMSYEDSLKITAPNDLGSVVGNCPNKQVGWVSKENKKQGIDW